LVEIVDLNGKVLASYNSGTVEQWKGGTVELDISHLPEGQYFLKITTGKDVFAGKLIKVR
jgi:hypothetical protein